VKIVKSNTVMRFATLMLGAAAIVCTGLTVRAQAAPAKAGSNKSYEIDVPGTKEWVDTNIDVLEGQSCASRPRGKSHIRPTIRSGKSRTL
jgi:hypothetical protein